MAPRRHPVVLLSVHDLLGHGIAQYVLDETGVDVTVVSAHDEAGVLAALALDPRVVIYERSPVVDALDLAALAPHAVLIDVSTVVTTGTRVPEQSTPGEVERILSAVHPEHRAG